MKKARKTNTDQNKRESAKRVKDPSIHGFVSLSLCAAAVLTITGGCKLISSERHSQVYAAAEEQKVAYVTDGGYDLPSGIAGVASGVSGTPSAGMTVNRLGISCEDMMVGQRIRKVTSDAVEMNVSESLAVTIDALDAKVASLSASAKIMSDEDYENLLRIVEAEAGTEDLKGRILVANVIMNRIKYPEFPNTATDVIWEYNNGVAQFSPVSDGSINHVTISDKTKEAVKQVLEGVDYSEGALFFIQKSAAEKHNIDWFEKNLHRLFKHGVHEFYTYPDDVLEK